MVAVIHCTCSISGTIKYNERKLNLNKADCILAANYAKDLKELSYDEKVHRLEYQAAINERAKAIAVHISLNFHPADILDLKRLRQISGEYMTKIGFGEQPYLVYQHFDAGHPHLHIVSTNILHNGRQLKMYNIVCYASQDARKELEIKYNLVRASGKGQRQNDLAEPEQGYISKVIYGKYETTSAISRVLDHVLNHYKFTNLVELNMILKQYNLAVDRGREGSLMYEKKGLYYRVLDKDGSRIGMPIKASKLPNKPTLKNLEIYFVKNLAQKQEIKQKIKTSLDWIFLKNNKLSLQSLKAELGHEGITAMVNKSKGGLETSITYIEHKKGAVISADELGAIYSLDSIFEKCGINGKLALTGRPENKQPVKQTGTSIKTEFVLAPAKQLLNWEKDLPSPVTGYGEKEKGRLLTLDELVRSLSGIQSDPDITKPEIKRRLGLQMRLSQY